MASRSPQREPQEPEDDMRNARCGTLLSRETADQHRIDQAGELIAVPGQEAEQGRIGEYRPVEEEGQPDWLRPAQPVSRWDVTARAAAVSLLGSVEERAV